jgi:hypothetical protein
VVSVTNPYGRILGFLYQVDTDCNRNVCQGGNGLQARKAEDFKAVSEPTVCKIWGGGASTSHNPIGLHGLLQG